MAYTTIDNPTLFFNTVLYSGTGSNQSITGVGFQPDWIWGKGRTLSGYNHGLVDSVRGTGKNLYSNLTEAEETYSTGVTSFDSDGFSVGSGNVFNNGSNTYVGWNWKAGTSASGNTGGSGTAKTYSGSVNTDAGFSIINFVGNGTAGHTIPHHLGVAPKMVIVKNRTSGSTFWQTYHYNLDNGAGTHEIFLNSTNATNASSGAWNNTVPSSTVVTKGTGSYGNENNSNHIMYSFAEKKGYSKFGSYTGNGNADGSFIFCGFKPAFVIVKLSSASGQDWQITDIKRNSFNTVDKLLYANGNNAEVTSGSHPIDYLSNGFKCRGTGDGNNGSGKTYIFMAFAEQPFVNSNGVPNNAR